MSDTQYIPEPLSKENGFFRRATPGKRRGWGQATTVAVLAAAIVGAFGLAVNLTAPTFHRSSATKITVPTEPTETESVVCTGLRDTLLAQDISLALAPVWFPGGYGEGEIRAARLSSRQIFMAQYSRGEESIIVRVGHYSDTDTLHIAQNASLIETYRSGDVDYRIYGTERILQAVWVNGGFECYISGPVTVPEMERMIDSIGVLPAATAG